MWGGGEGGQSIVLYTTEVWRVSAVSYPPRYRGVACVGSHYRGEACVGSHYRGVACVGSQLSFALQRCGVCRQSVVLCTTEVWLVSAVSCPLRYRGVACVDSQLSFALQRCGVCRQSVVLCVTEVWRVSAVSCPLRYRGVACVGSQLSFALQRCGVCRQSVVLCATEVQQAVQQSADPLCCTDVTGGPAARHLKSTAYAAQIGALFTDSDKSVSPVWFIRVANNSLYSVAFCGTQCGKRSAVSCPVFHSCCKR